MSKRLVITVLTLLLSIVLIACGDSGNETQADGSNDGETITLSVADYVNSSQIFYTDGSTYWMDRVEELTDGQVEFEYYPTGQLGDSTALIEHANNRTIDVAGFGGSYVSNIMPLAEVSDLPGIYSSAEEGTKAYWEIANSVLLENTYLDNGVKPIWVAATPPYQIITNDRKIEDPEDFKGLTIRTAGGVQDNIAQSMGAGSVAIEGPEILQALERGTADAIFSDISSITSYQLYETSSYSTTNAELSGFVINYVINSDTYEGLPDNVKDAIDQASEETMEHLAQAQTELVESELESLPEAGMEFNELNDEQLKEWDDQLKDVRDNWVSSLEERGYPAQEALDALMDAVESIE